MRALLVVPYEGVAVVPDIECECSDVVCGVCESEDLVADEVSGGGFSDGDVVVCDGYYGELLDGVPSKVCAVDFLTCDVVKREAV